MITIHRSRLVLLLTLLGLLTACGFTLRGSEPATTDIDSLLLQTPSASQLAPILIRQLQFVGITVLPASDEAQSAYLLHIGDEDISRRALTASSRARGAQYQVSMAISMQLHQHDTLVSGPHLFRVERRHDEDTANLAGSARELDRLYDEMREVIAVQLLRHLQSLTAPES